jgi:hypothetical protein
LPRLPPSLFRIKGDKLENNNYQGWGYDPLAAQRRGQPHSASSLTFESRWWFDNERRVAFNANDPGKVVTFYVSPKASEKKFGLASYSIP